MNAQCAERIRGAECCIFQIEGPELFGGAMSLYACALLNRTTCSFSYTCIFTALVWSEFGLAEQSGVAAGTLKSLQKQLPSELPVANGRRL